MSRTSRALLAILLAVPLLAVTATATSPAAAATPDRGGRPQSGVEERRWICATTARRVTACSAHLSTRGSLEAQAANDAQCAELAAVLATYEGAVVFGGDVNRLESCAPSGWWTLTDAAAAQTPGIQHVYGSDRLAAPNGTVVPAVHTDHDFLRADARLVPGPR